MPLARSAASYEIIEEIRSKNTRASVACLLKSQIELETILLHHNLMNSNPVIARNDSMDQSISSVLLRRRQLNH